MLKWSPAGDYFMTAKLYGQFLYLSFSSQEEAILMEFHKSFFDNEYSATGFLFLLLQWWNILSMGDEHMDLWTLVVH